MPVRGLFFGDGRCKFSGCVHFYSISSVQTSSSISHAILGAGKELSAFPTFRYRYEITKVQATDCTTTTTS